MYQIIQFAVFYICAWIYWNKEKAKFYVTAKYLALYDGLRSICYSNNQLIIWYLVKLLFRYDILKSITHKFGRFAVSLFVLVLNPNLKILNHCTRKWSFWIWSETADLVTFTEQILNGKLHFLCSEYLFLDYTMASWRCLQRIVKLVYKRSWEYFK